jgi:hypothetical protein
VESKVITGSVWSGVHVESKVISGPVWTGIPRAFARTRSQGIFRFSVARRIGAPYTYRDFCGIVAPSVKPLQSETA